MEVDVAREYFIFDKETKEKLGKGYPIGMSLMAFAALFLATILFFVIFLPAIANLPKFEIIDLIPLTSVPVLFTLSIYLYYEIIGNYLYYKGKWKDPPFAKRSVKMFWRDLKRGRMPGLINYLGLFIAVGITLILIGGVIKYMRGDDKYREKHRRELIRAFLEGSIFILIGILVYLYGE